MHTTLVPINDVRIDDRLYLGIHAGKPRTEKVRSLTPCPGKPECVHLNDSMCFDRRFGQVKIVARTETIEE